MQSSCITHPPASRHVRVYEWQLKATGGNECAAKLIGFFTFHHDRLLAGLESAKMINEQLLAAGREPFFDMAGWQFHKDDYIKAGLLNTYGRDAIKKATDILIGLGFLEDNPPEKLKERYKVGRCKGFRFRSDKVRAWIKQHYPDDKAPEAPAATPPKKQSPLMDEMTDIPAEVKAAALEVVEDWKRVHNHPEAIATPERQRYVVKLLKRGYTVERLKIACRGVLFSEWHQGKNDRQKVWDKISIIFEDGEKVEEFEDLARAKGVTAANLENYGKKPKKEQPLGKPAWRVAIDNCPLCDENGRVNTPQGIAICQHVAV